MPVNRHGPTPFFIKYVTQNVLIPSGAAAPPNLSDYLEADAQWIDVPNYQRGIAWTVDELQELLESRSVLLGNVVLGKFTRPPTKFPFVPPQVTTYSVLVDGLQRLSIGTVLLAILYPEVLSEGCNRPNLMPYFSRLRIKTKDLHVVFIHNDNELLHHSRKAIADAYQAFRAHVKAFLFHQLDGQHSAQVLAANLTRLFLDRQVAVDLYSDFGKPLELIYTFIGMNTVRVDLSPVDLVRSVIVEKAISSSWDSAAVEAFENRFTGTFTEEEKPLTHLLPFVAILQNTLDTDAAATRLFPSWTSALSQQEVSSFLDYVAAFEDCISNPYLGELKACGAIPYAGLLSFYYGNYLSTALLPAFLTGNPSENPALRAFLRANLRVLLDGSIGRTRSYAERAFAGEFTTLSDYSDSLSFDFLGRNIGQAVSPDWLTQSLRDTDKNRSKRVFNAMRLPITDADDFSPDAYGAKTSEFHIDHLIPQKAIRNNQNGYKESETILNFAPLPAKYNILAKTTPCAEKIGPSGMYANWIENETNPHPYCVWLVQSHSAHGSDLDLQEHLEPNLTPDIVGKRLQWMKDRLLERL